MRKLAQDSLQKNAAMEIMIDKRTSEILGPGDGCICYKVKFYFNFIVLIDHKVVYCKAEVLMH